MNERVHFVGVLLPRAALDGEDRSYNLKRFSMHGRTFLFHAIEKSWYREQSLREKVLYSLTKDG